MAQFLTDKYLKYRAAAQGGPIETDRPCEQCGYNLRGLRFGGTCPECGLPIRYRRQSTLAFHEMPLALQRGFGRGCWLVTAAIAGLVVLWLAGLGALSPPVRLGLLGGVLVLWLAGVWLLTPTVAAPEAVARGFSPRGRLRAAARWLQAGWLVALPAAAGYTAGLPALAPLGTAGLVVGAVGTAAFALFLARLADWVNDELAAKALRFSVWAVPLAVGLAIVGSIAAFLLGPLGGLALLLTCPTLLLVPAAAVAFPVALFSLSNSLQWSAAYARQRADRDRRLHERISRSSAARPAGGEASGPPESGRG